MIYIYIYIFTFLTSDTTEFDNEKQPYEMS